MSDTTKNLPNDLSRFGERRGEGREQRGGKRGEGRKERRGQEREERIEDGRGKKGGRKMSGKGGKLKGVMDSYQIAATFLIRP